MTGGWFEAVQEADRLQADYPGWRVRAVRRRTGPGVSAQRGGNGLCLVMGTPAEVRTVLASAERQPAGAGLRPFARE